MIDPNVRCERPTVWGRGIAVCGQCGPCLESKGALDALRGPETPADMVARVKLMADGGPKWDLSPKDRAALAHVISRMVDAESAVNRLMPAETALRQAVEDTVKRCWECDGPAAWHEVGWTGQDKFWCEEHVEIPQRAISKGAGRYQPQRIRYPEWIASAMKALGSPTPGAGKDE